MTEQSSPAAQPLDRHAPSAPSPNKPTSTPATPVGESSPRGPWRSLGGPGVEASAAQFGLDWGTASASVRAVAAEACARVPEEWELEGPGICLSLGDAVDLDPDLLEAMVGPDGLGGQSLGPQFGQDRAADALRPGPLLAALTEQAVAGTAFLSDDQLTGAMRAVRRQQARNAWQETMLVAEFARRRDAQLADAKARGVPKGRRPGEFPDEELASELLVTRNQAADRIDADRNLTSRLPLTLAGMANGTISGTRADTIAAYTASLADADAAHADEILAAAAPGLRVDQLARKAAALEMKLDPEAARIRKEHARNTRQRVELRREDSGNACLAGRELDTAQALASKAYIDAVAVKVRNYGGLDGSLGSVKALVMTELLQGRDPLNLIKPKPNLKHAPEPRPAGGQAGQDLAGTDPADGRPAGPGPEAADYPCHPDDPDDPGPDDGDSPHGPGYAGPDGRPSWGADEAEGARWHDPDDDEPTRRGPLRPGVLAPLPAAINLLIPVGTLLGWSATPAQANGIGLLGPDETRAIVAAASRHPRTRWCATIIGPDGTAAAHACAPGQHPWTDPPPETLPPETPPPTSPPATPPPATPPPATPPRRPGTTGTGDQPDAAQLARLRDLLGQLKLKPDPIARDTCDHRYAEDRYTPSRKLKHLLRARAQTCDAPGCNAQAVYCDLDHTTPHPDGPTCQCNLGPKCRRHHRAKQAPGWRVQQPEPGVLRWTLPSGRTHTTTPTVYDT
jgi:Domain of unknown function (DUF222)